MSAKIQQAAGAMMLADINSRVVAAALGANTVSNHCSVTAGSMFRVRDMERAMKEVAAMPKPVVGMVCRPDWMGRVRRIADAAAHPLFGAVPVHEKQDQSEPCRVFYDREKMDRYLAESDSDLGR